MIPLARVDDLVGAVYLPGDGVTNPVDTTRAFAKGARARGVTIREHTSVERIITENGRAVGVAFTADARVRRDPRGRSRQRRRACGDAISDRQAGAVVPLHAAEHFYIVTDAIEGIRPQMPVLRDPDGCGYFKEEVGKLLVGWFEPVAKPWGMKRRDGSGGIPESFSLHDPSRRTSTTSRRWSRRPPHRMPVLADTGIQLFFNGPESFTPDDRYLLGESPDVHGLVHGVRLQLDRDPVLRWRRQGAGRLDHRRSTPRWTCGTSTSAG